MGEGEYLGRGEVRLAVRLHVGDRIGHTNVPPMRCEAPVDHVIL